MINKAMFRQVQAFRRQGYSKASIVKALELDPKTVAKYFAMEEEGYRAYRQDQLYRDKVFDVYRKEILEVYEANSFRRLEVASVYDYLEEKYGALPANEQSLRNFIGYLIGTDGLRLDETARLYTKVPELAFGKQMQLDFGQYRCPSGLRLYIFAALLSASRYKYVIFQGKPFRTLDVIRLLLEAFDYFGGLRAGPDVWTRLLSRRAQHLGGRDGPAEKRDVRGRPRKAARQSPRPRLLFLRRMT